MSKLTPKQAAFVAEYLIDLNATQAAIRAGYSKKTAHVTGHENLKKPEIAAAVKTAIDARAEQAAVTAQEVIDGLRSEAEYFGLNSSHSARVAAWAHLGKHLGIFTDKTEVTLRKSPELMTDTELDAALRDAGLN